MFTGIVQTIGEVDSITAQDGDAQIQIAAPGLGLETVAIGDSIAVNGCCLTVTRLTENAFLADVSNETLSVTTLGDLNVGTLVNLEKALTAGQPLGGHYVTGHVDGVATVKQLESAARSIRMQIEVPQPLAKYIARKGSVTVDGVSLTVNEVGPTTFEVNLIPHTLDVTVLNRYTVGTRVNIEVDILARYMERLLTASQVSAPA